MVEGFLDSVTLLTVESVLEEWYRENPFLQAQIPMLPLGHDSSGKAPADNS